MGMAFADELQIQDPECSIIIVDRHASPGGHWNDAYPFVTLHQPALFYGVNSELLGTGGGDLSSRAEILAYYERVLAKMLRSGRVQYFPQSDSMGGTRFRSLLEPDLEYEVRVHRKIVDATYMNVEVPSVRGPQYEVAEGADLVPINGLADLRQPVGAVVVVGAGKTGIDAVLYLLGRGVAPERIHWVIPNDSWFLDRAHIQPNQPVGKGLGGQLEVLLASDTMEEAMAEMSRREQLLRLDPEVWPTKYRCATVSRSELDELRRVRQVIRKGRVVRVEAARMTLEQGEWSSSEKVLFVDCTADGLARRDRCPVFEGPRITLHSLVPHPVDTRDFLVAMAVSSANLQAWGQSFGRWLRRSRLSLASHQTFPNLVRQAWQSYRSLRSNPEAFENLLAREFPESYAPVPPESSRRD